MYSHPPAWIKEDIVPYRVGPLKYGNPYIILSAL